MKGKVKWYNTQKGFGFIIGEDGREYFAHYSQIQNNLVLEPDMEVQFETKTTDKGVQAIKIY